MKPTNPGTTFYVWTYNGQERLYRRIELRVDNMISAGLVDEVRRLLKRLWPGTEFHAQPGL